MTVYKTKTLKNIIRNYQLYLLILPTLIYVLVYYYQPMYGLQIAFRDYTISQGFFNSTWVGLKHFIRFVSMPNFWALISNTLGLSLYQLVAGFPLPIMLAIMINEVKNEKFKKSLQMVTYAPHFISTVVLTGIIVLFLNKDTGIINHIISLLGGTRTSFLIRPEWFKTIYVLSGVWQNTGFGAIIYLAALSAVDIQIIESSIIDGANRIQKILYVDIPSIAPTIIILLILNIGSLLSVGFEKVLLLQNPLNMQVSEIIATFVYNIGLLGGQFSFTTAIGLFNSIINLILLLTVNHISRKISETSLW